MTVQLSASRASLHQIFACDCAMRTTEHTTCSLPWLTGASNSSLQ